MDILAVHHPTASHSREGFVVLDEQGEGVLHPLAEIDPRITDAPAMIDVPAATVRLGLAPRDLDRVADEYRHDGVKREWIEKECPGHEIRS